MAEGSRDKERTLGGALGSTSAGGLRGLARSLSLRPRKAVPPQTLGSSSLATDGTPASGKGSLDAMTTNGFSNSTTGYASSALSPTSAGFTSLGFATLQSPTRKTSRTERRPAHQLFDEANTSSPNGRGTAVGSSDGAVVEWGRPPAQTDTTLRDAQIVGVSADNTRANSNNSSSSNPLRSVPSVSSVGAGHRLARVRDASGGTSVPSKGGSLRVTTLRDAPLSSSDPALEVGVHDKRGKGVDRGNSSAPAGLTSTNDAANSSTSSNGGSSLVKKLSLRRKPLPRAEPSAATGADQGAKSPATSSSSSPYHLAAPFGRRSFDSLVSITSRDTELAPSYTQRAVATDSSYEKGHARRKTATDRQVLDSSSGAVGHSPSSSRGFISSTTRGRPAREGSALPTSSAYPTGYWAPPPYAYATAQDGGEHGISLGDEMDAVLSSEARERREALRGHSPPFFAVRRGWRKGIYIEEAEASRQTQNFPGPIVKRFENADEAVAFVCAPSNPSKPSFTRQDSSDSVLPRPVAAPARPTTARTSTLGRSRSLASSTTSGRSFGARRGAAMGYLDEPSQSSPSSTSGQSFSFENESLQIGTAPTPPLAPGMSRNASNRPASRRGAENAMPSLDEDGADHSVSVTSTDAIGAIKAGDPPAPFNFPNTAQQRVTKDRPSPSLAYFAMAPSPLAANAVALGAEAFGRAASPSGLTSEHPAARARISPLILGERPDSPAAELKLVNGGGAVLVVENVTDLERSLAFYSTILGATLARRQAGAMLLRLGAPEGVASPATRLLLRAPTRSPFEDQAERVRPNDARETFASRSDGSAETSQASDTTGGHSRTALLLEVETEVLCELRSSISKRITEGRSKQIVAWSACAVGPVTDSLWGTKEVHLTGPDGEEWILSSPLT